jgi:DNA-binding SARP family transcriptional activator/TolB-like protein
MNDGGKETIRFLVFDGFRLETPNRSTMLGAKLRGLVAVLCAARGKPVSRERLATLFWGSHFELQAQQNLRQAIARLRRPLGEAIHVSPTAVAAAPEYITSDLAEFEDGICHSDAEVVERALAVFGRGLLDAPSIEEEGWREWLGAERERIETLALEARLRLAAVAMAQDAMEQAVAHARQAIALDPFREDAHRLLMTALARMGRRTEALRCYETLVRDLKRELGVAPDECTRMLAEELRAQSSATTAGRAGSAIPVGFPVVLQQKAVLSVERLTQQRGELPGTDQHIFESTRAALKEALSLRAANGAGVRFGVHAAGDPQSAEARDAARHLCTIASPGEILLSPDAIDTLSPLDAGLEDMGERASALDGTPVRSFRLTAEASPAPLIPVFETLLPAIAVLPFAIRGMEGGISGGISGGMEAGLAFLGEALADELIATLSRSSEVTMISRLSTSGLAGRDMRLQDFRERVGANYVLSGAISLMGKNATVVAEFADARSGAVVWADRFALRLEDILGSDGLAASLLPQLVATILRVEMRRVAAPRAMRLDDCMLLFGAIALLHQTAPSKLVLADEILAELASRAPMHAAPHAWRAMACVIRANQGWTSDAGAEADRALASAALALEAEPECSLALAVDAHVQTHFRRRFDLAREGFARAVEANPNDSLAWLLKSTLHTFQSEGRQAVGDTLRARRLSPLDPRRWYYETLAASANVAAGDYDEAVRLARSSIRGNRLHASTFRALVIALSLGGRSHEARQAAQELLHLQPDLTASAYRTRHAAGAAPAGSLYAEALREAGIPP